METIERPWLYVALGDIVSFDFRHYTEPSERYITGEITQITPNYGSDRPLPLLQYRDVAIGGLAYADQVYVTSIVKRYQGPVKAPRNIFAEFPSSHLAMWQESRGIWVGMVTDMVTHCLASLNREFTRNLNDRAIDDAFHKQRPGYLGPYGSGGSGVVRVRQKPFRAWAVRNASRFQYPVRRLHEDADMYTRMEAGERLGELSSRHDYELD
jgi:hypothetical protein